MNEWTVRCIRIYLKLLSCVLSYIAFGEANSLLKIYTIRDKKQCITTGMEINGIFIKQNIKTEVFSTNCDK
jgi:hypothetical protein